ncbi:MAG TPA: ABC-F family ATP-binding cassette domain-containing protein [Anaerolineae bacterium]|nr:ABC-F family ATP-binding cassette domain-containing protein [Anaerolineae bacterium]HQK15046.1 ABC-F family ATP-binding cassette domain-containing protein [Anaerolineae bacterium]
MLQVSNITKYYGDAIILDGVTFTINAGERVGLIGPNGCGKTTLLRIITGQETPDSGSVLRDPPDLRVGYLEQGLTYHEDATLDHILRAEEIALEQLERNITALADALAAAGGAEQERLMDAYGEALAELERLVAHQIPPHEVKAILAGLGLDDVSLDTPVRHLSGGQKTRLGLARLLIQNPQMLLLDEPTNHLDIEALEWLEGWLRTYRGAVLIVSHDRTFLDNTVTHILDLDPLTHTITAYTGNYSAYIEEWTRRREKQWAQWRDEQAEIRRLQADIHRTKMQAMSVELTTTPGDPTTRRYAKKVAKKAIARERRLERYMESDERVEKPALTWRMKLEFVDTPASGQEVLRLRGVSVGYNGVPLLHDVNQTLRQGERVALIGANGCGKTTLLRAIVGQITPLSGTIHLGANVKTGYYAQEQENLDPNSTPFDTLRQVAAMSDTDVRSFLHYFLFTGDEVFTPVRNLSYGERARLVLARLVASGCNFLLLDEPINHLDIPSRASFEQAMTTFEGTVLAVVHDRYFIRQFATGVWSVEEGTVKEYVDLEDYQRIQRFHT